VKFLIDENISPLVAERLRNFGYGARQAPETGFKGLPDSKCPAQQAVRHPAEAFYGSY